MTEGEEPLNLWQIQLWGGEERAEFINLGLSLDGTGGLSS